METINKDLLPTFLIVGAARGGTTSLYHYLSQHPDILMTKLKEPSFFYFFKNGSDPSFNEKTNVCDLKSYQAFFDHPKKFEFRGDASTPYLFTYKKTIETIKRVYGEDYRKLKIIISLRNPVDRAYSQYGAYRRNMLEDLSFSDALKMEDHRRKNGFSFDYFYKSKGYYFNQVKAYLEDFDDVLIYLYEDFRDDPQKMIDNILDFIGANQEIIIDSTEKHNVSGIPKSRLIQNLWMSDYKLKKYVKSIIPEGIKSDLKSFIKKNNLRKEELDKEIRKSLKKEFSKDIKELQNLINRDLSSWQ